MEILMKKRFSLAVLMLSLAVPGASASELLEVSLGYSQVIGPVADMSTVIIGDDSVAGATLGSGGTIILTGRMLGATNLIVLDEKGRELLASPLQVVPLDRRPTTNIRVVKAALKADGFEAQDYVCGPDTGCVAAAGKPAAFGPATAATAEEATTETPDTPEAIEAPETDRATAEEQASLDR
jgi:hypothetical protein